MPIEVRLQTSLRRVYEVFADAPKPQGDLSCLDFGPSIEERAAFEAHDLQTFPGWLIDRLEFFSRDWRSWGTEPELRYFLPRILDRLCEHLIGTTTDQAGMLLKGLDSKFSLMGDWPQLPALQGFLLALLEEQLDGLFERRRPWSTASDGVEAVVRLIVALPCALAPFVEQFAKHPLSYNRLAAPALDARKWEQWVCETSTTPVDLMRLSSLCVALRQALERSDLWEWDEH